MVKTTSSQLEEHWDWIESQRAPIANAIKQLADELSTSDRKILLHLADWFSRKASYQNAIRRPDVLSLCAALINTKDANGEQGITRAVRTGFSSIMRSRLTQSRRLAAFLYPSLMLFATISLVAFFSCFIIPQYESFFDDFGIRLPQATAAIIKLGAIIRTLLVPILLIAISFPLVCLFAMTSSKNDDDWLAIKLKPRNLTAANWSWHMASLIELGFGIPEAVRIAGQSQRKNWLATASSNWLRQTAKESPARSESSLLFEGRFHLLDTTLHMDHAEAQVCLFREIAIYFWTRDRIITEWWTRLVVSFLFWFLVATSVFVLFVIYQPLFAIISGLT